MYLCVTLVCYIIFPIVVFFGLHFSFSVAFPRSLYPIYYERFVFYNVAFMYVFQCTAKNPTFFRHCCFLYLIL